MKKKKKIYKVCRKWFVGFSFFFWLIKLTDFEVETF